MHTYLIIDATSSLYYHQSKTKMADSSEDELSDTSEDFEVSSSSEDRVREDELERSRPVSRLLPFRGPELYLKFPAAI